jgi:uncharacterized heparinase superfamily protein
MLRYWHAVRYQPTSQVVGRLRLAASMMAWRGASATGLNAAIGRLCDLRAGGFYAKEDFRFPDSGPYPHGGFLGGNRFRFLEEEVDFRAAIDWGAPDKSLLWQFHLHYFDWLPRLAREQPGLALEQVDSWVGSNPAGLQPAWHPYPTSLRIVNWVRTLALPGDANWSERTLQSLSRQAAFLEANLEYHLGGNHLIENAYALLVAGLFFRCAAAPRWESRGLRLLVSELEKQVFADGGHFERSLWYHFRVNLVCRDAVRLLRVNGRAVPPELIEIDDRMSRFTEGLLHEDGNIPLFHDSQLIEEEAWTRFHSLQPA